MLRWLTYREYNRMDIIWLVLGSCAAIDRRWWLMLCIMTIGALTSGVLEAIQAKRVAPGEKLREGKELSNLKPGRNPPPTAPKPPPPPNPPARHNA